MYQDVKLPLPEIEGILRRLVELKARSLGQVKEIDVYFDDGDRSLERYGKVLRIRENGKKVVLCFKDTRNIDGPMIQKKEVEVEIPGTQETADILRGLGFRPVGKVEKIRQKFLYQRVSVCIDKLPFIGHFLELQGRQENVKLVAELLRINPEQSITKNYLELSEDYMRDKGIRLQNDRELTFQDETRYVKI